MTTERRYGIDETATRTDAQYPESDLARRAREIVDGTRGRGAPGTPNGESLDAIERERTRRRMAGELPGLQSYHGGLPTRRGDDASAQPAPLSTDDELEAIEARLHAQGKSQQFIDQYLEQWKSSHRTEELRTAKLAGMSHGQAHATAQHEHESTRK